MSMKRLLPCSLLCLGLLAATAAAEYRLPLRPMREDPVAIVPVKKAAAARPAVTAADDGDDLLTDPAAVRDAQAARLAALRQRAAPETAQQASILPSALGLLGGCLVAAMGMVVGVRLWKKKVSQLWAEAVRARSRKRTVLLLRGIIVADSCAGRRPRLASVSAESPPRGQGRLTP